MLTEPSVRLLLPKQESVDAGNFGKITEPLNS